MTTILKNINIRFCIITTFICIYIPLFTACAVDDTRDECCEEVVFFHRYMKHNTDLYKENIKSMEHFLFDEAGTYLYKLTFNPASPQRIKIKNMIVGNYTLVTVANVGKDTISLTSLAKNTSNINDFQLNVEKMFRAGAYSNTNEIFWSTRNFSIEASKRHYYICDLSNIHCHLFVKVIWNTIPPFPDKYEMEIRDVPISYSLDYNKSRAMFIYNPKGEKENDWKSTEDNVVHRFPANLKQLGAHRIPVTMEAQKLVGEFISLRYTNTNIPTFQLFRNDKAQTKPIDLSIAFNSWGWRPNNNPEQIYRIEMEIFDDGRVVVNQWANVSIKDWQDGGVIN